MTNKMIRIIRDGIPCYVAEWYKDLSPRSKYEMHRCCNDYQSGASAPAKMRNECAATRYPQTTYLPLFQDEPINHAIAAE